mmetsp:Transcript_56495/g.94061  ORF Transcript_56495/g.94061 Transcript_56495/m.94061 type:complete len:166 (-) Transcript_56495:82-579(-)
MSLPRKEDSLETVRTGSTLDMHLHHTTEHASQSNSSEHIKQPQPFDWIKQILDDQKIEHYDPAIFDILHDYAYYYLSSVLKEAAENTLHRTDGKSLAVDFTDIEFAKKRLHKTQTFSPNLLQVLEDAAQVNRIPLPFVSHHYKMKLPPKPYRLTSQNFQLNHTNE